jgi:hypothetical protein
MTVGEHVGNFLRSLGLNQAVGVVLLAVGVAAFMVVLTRGPLPRHSTAGVVASVLGIGLGLCLVIPPTI